MIGSRTEQFSEITSQSCYYCGEQPGQVVKKARDYTNGEYIYNGVDRLDNSRGYTKDNCVPCCGTCNSMKSDSSVGEFITRITKIYQIHGGK